MNTRSVEGIEVRPVWYVGRCAESFPAEEHGLKKFARPPDAYGVYRRGIAIHHERDFPTKAEAQSFAARQPTKELRS